MSTRQSVKMKGRALDILKRLPLKNTEDITMEDTETEQSAYAAASHDFRSTIPTPPIRIVEDYDKRSFKPFHPPEYYIKFMLNTGALNISDSVAYDVLEEDVKWLREFNAAHGTKVGVISEEAFAKTIESYEIEIWKLTYPDYVIDPSCRFTCDEALEYINNSPLTETALREIYAYWRRRRMALGKALIRQFQAPPAPENLSPHVAFRPRAQGRRASHRHPRKNDILAYHKMRLLINSFTQLQQILSDVRLREQLKLEESMLDMEITDSTLLQTEYVQWLGGRAETKDPQLQERIIAADDPGITLPDDAVPIPTPATEAALARLFVPLGPRATYGTPGCAIQPVRQHDVAKVEHPQTKRRVEPRARATATNLGLPPRLAALIASSDSEEVSDDENDVSFLNALTDMAQDQRLQLTQNMVIERGKAVGEHMYRLLSFYGDCSAPKPHLRVVVEGDRMPFTTTPPTLLERLPEPLLARLGTCREAVLTRGGNKRLLHNAEVEVRVRRLGLQLPHPRKSRSVKDSTSTSMSDSDGRVSVTVHSTASAESASSTLSAEDEDHLASMLCAPSAQETLSTRYLQLQAALGAVSAQTQYLATVSEEQREPLRLQCTLAVSVLERELNAVSNSLRAMTDAQAAAENVLSAVARSSAPQPLTVSLDDSESHVGNGGTITGAPNIPLDHPLRSAADASRGGFQVSTEELAQLPPGTVPVLPVTDLTAVPPFAPSKAHARLLVRLAHLRERYGRRRAAPSSGSGSLMYLDTNGLLCAPDAVTSDDGSLPTHTTDIPIPSVSSTIITTTCAPTVSQAKSLRLPATFAHAKPFPYGVRGVPPQMYLDSVNANASLVSLLETAHTRDALLDGTGRSVPAASGSTTVPSPLWLHAALGTWLRMVGVLDQPSVMPDTSLILRNTLEPEPQCPPRTSRRAQLKPPADPSRVCPCAPFGACRDIAAAGIRVLNGLLVPAAVSTQLAALRTAGGLTMADTVLYMLPDRSLVCRARAVAAMMEALKEACAVVESGAVEADAVSIEDILAHAHPVPLNSHVTTPLSAAAPSSLPGSLTASAAKDVIAAELSHVAGAESMAVSLRGGCESEVTLSLPALTGATSITSLGIPVVGQPYERLRNPYQTLVEKTSYVNMHRDDLSNPFITPAITANAECAQAAGWPGPDLTSNPHNTVVSQDHAVGLPIAATSVPKRMDILSRQVMAHRLEQLTTDTTTRKDPALRMLLNSTTTGAQNPAASAAHGQVSNGNGATGQVDTKLGKATIDAIYARALSTAMQTSSPLTATDAPILLFSRKYHQPALAAQITADGAASAHDAAVQAARLHESVAYRALPPGMRPVYTPDTAVDLHHDPVRVVRGDDPAFSRTLGACFPQFPVDPVAEGGILLPTSILKLEYNAPKAKAARSRADGARVLLSKARSQGAPDAPVREETKSVDELGFSTARYTDMAPAAVDMVHTTHRALHSVYATLKTLPRVHVTDSGLMRATDNTGQGGWPLQDAAQLAHTHKVLNAAMACGVALPPSTEMEAHTVQNRVKALGASDPQSVLPNTRAAVCKHDPIDANVSAQLNPRGDGSVSIPEGESIADDADEAPVKHQLTWDTDRDGPSVLHREPFGYVHAVQQELVCPDEARARVYDVHQGRIAPSGKANVKGENGAYVPSEALAARVVETPGNQELSVFARSQSLAGRFAARIGRGGRLVWDAVRYRPDVCVTTAPVKMDPNVATVQVRIDAEAEKEAAIISQRLANGEARETVAPCPRGTCKDVCLCDQDPVVNALKRRKLEDRVYRQKAAQVQYVVDTRMERQQVFAQITKLDGDVKSMYTHNYHDEHPILPDTFASK